MILDSYESPTRGLSYAVHCAVCLNIRSVFMKYKNKIGELFNPKFRSTLGISNKGDFYIPVTPYALRGKGGRREIFGPAGGSVTLIA
jgi:hypothetical protein